MSSGKNSTPPMATKLGKRLFVAIDKGNLTLARELLEQGADVNYHDEKKGASPLVRAVARKRGVEFLKLLVKCGADVNYRAPLAGTPLLNAVVANDIEAFRFLVRCDAAPLQHESAGDLLIEACGHGLFEIAKELISLGADVNAQNVIGQTALAQAVIFERLDLVRLLLQAGASPHSGGPEATAADWAAEFSSPELKRLLGIKPDR